MMVSSSGSGSGSRYLDPHSVYELVVRRMPGELLDYLDLIPGASQDMHCYKVKLIGNALLSQPPSFLSSSRKLIPEENRWIMNLGQEAWVHAIDSRLCAPQKIGDPSNFTSDAGHSMRTQNSSSYSGRVLTNEPELRHAAMHNQLSASRSRNHTATFPTLKENSNDAQVLEEIIQNNFSPQELGQNNHGTLELGTFWLSHPGSEQFTLQRLIPNIKWLPTGGIKGKRPAAPEVYQREVKILRLNVASLVAQDGLNSAAGVLIRDGSTSQFISASCFSPILRTEPALLFAAACCKGIKIAVISTNYCCAGVPPVHSAQSAICRSESTARYSTVETIPVPGSPAFHTLEHSRRIQSCCLSIGP